MKTLDLKRIETIEAGGFGDVVNGACAAVGAASLFGWIALSNPVGWAIGGGCLINAIGNGAGWWY